MVCFVFNTKFLNASGFEDLSSLRNKSLALNEAGIIFSIMDKKHKGATSELIATVWLLKKGYEVFRNVSQHGAVDIIARDSETGKIIFIDVTSLHKRKTPNEETYHCKKSKFSNIKILAVDIETNYVYWSHDKIFKKRLGWSNQHRNSGRFSTSYSVR